MPMVYEGLTTIFLWIFLLVPTTCFHNSAYVLRKRTINFVRPTSQQQEEGGSSREIAAALVLQNQAEMLRAEALSLQRALNETKAQKLARESAKVDLWLEQILVNQTISKDMQLLNTVERVTEVLKERRFSPEQVNKIFNRICEDRPQSRTNCSPIMALLVDAVGKLDELEENPNKRWNGKVERVLRKRLFAMDWGMDVDDDDRV